MNNEQQVQSEENFTIDDLGERWGKIYTQALATIILLEKKVEKQAATIALLQTEEAVLTKLEKALKEEMPITQDNKKPIQAA